MLCAQHAPRAVDVAMSVSNPNRKKEWGFGAWPRAVQAASDIGASVRQQLDQQAGSLRVSMHGGRASVDDAEAAAAEHGVQVQVVRLQVLL